MSHRLRVLFLTAGILAPLVLLLVIGGLIVRSLLASIYSEQEMIRQTRAVADASVVAQLSEENSLHGFLATRERLYVTPYDESRGTLLADLAWLRSAASNANITSAVSAIDDAWKTTDIWSAYVAGPLLERPDRQGAHSLQRRGKKLVDHFRHKISVVDLAFRDRAASVRSRAERAISLIGMFTFAATALVATLGAVLLVGQFRAMTALEDARNLA